ncbi:MAG: GntR family transcriptional regulator [Tardiphaga sp.]|jgi:DNA-binding GntR family transcriptional regulator|nr:GntR family transcriptional regulator [Mesorhizobium sp.]
MAHQRIDAPNAKEKNVLRSPSLKPASDEAVESRSASAIVTDALREGILHGTLPGGERLRQDAIATRFGVSQMIVREAFRQLVTEGFLKAEPRRGVSVAYLTADEAQEMTELRSLIEAKALEWAIPQMSKADLETAARILAELDKAKSTDRIIALNARFHETLYAPARKDRTLAMVANLRLNFERYLRFTWQETHHLDQSQREHRQILDFCIAGDAEGACTLLKQHILGTGRLLVERLQARQSG